jgi:signal transduction histidine kinase/ABC-type amino acid transport substrate-binding protein
MVPAAAEETGQPAAAEQPVVIGVLSFRPIDQTLQQWAPIAEYLSRSVPGHAFRVEPMNYPDLDRAVKEGRLDFVFTNPDHFVLLRNQISLAPILTVMPQIDGHPVNSFGGVIVSRSDRFDINRLEDLAGRSVASPSEESLGGNLMQLWEMRRQGISFPKVSYLGMPHDRSVQAVIDRTADAAFVRTGVLEGMAREGKLNLSDIKVINQRPRGEYPQILSTALYPEWPFCSTGKTPEALVKTVSLALLSLEPGDPVTKASGFFGFSPPGDYSSVEAVMLRLRVHPGRMDEFDLRDVIGKYATVLVGALTLLLLLAAAAAAYLVVVNRASALLLKQRDGAQSALSNSIRALEETNRELEQFAYVASHDLREPLRMVSSFATLLERSLGANLNEDQKEYICFVQDGTKRMNQLILDLLELSRVGHTENTVENVDLKEMVGVALLNLSVAIAESKATINLPPIMPLVTCAPREMTRVFQNLIANAIKYSDPSRSPQIDVQVNRIAEGWQVTLDDNGIGIPPEQAERVFQIFQRLHGKNAYGGGTGIGLSVCKKIIECHKGRIWVEPNPTGVGSRFIFTIGSQDSQTAFPSSPSAKRS